MRTRIHIIWLPVFVATISLSDWWSALNIVWAEVIRLIPS